MQKYTSATKPLPQSFGRLTRRDGRGHCNGGISRRVARTLSKAAHLWTAAKDGSSEIRRHLSTIPGIR